MKSNGLDILKVQPNMRGMSRALQGALLEYVKENIVDFVVIRHSSGTNNCPLIDDIVRNKMKG